MHRQPVLTFTQINVVRKQTIQQQYTNTCCAKTKQIGRQCIVDRFHAKAVVTLTVVTCEIKH